MHRFTDYGSACVSLQPTPHPTEDLVLLSQEDPSLVEKPGPSTEELTPESGPALPSPPPETTKRETPSLELEVLLHKKNQTKCSSERIFEYKHALIPPRRVNLEKR